MNLLQILKEQILAYENYEQGLVKIIGYPGYLNTDCKVCSMMSYAEWISSYQTYPVIKIEGLESIDLIKTYFSKASMKNIHLFINQRYGYSFNWHRDEVNVMLYILKGKKKVHIRDKDYILHPMQYAIIPKGYLHRATSIKDTWALSIGY